MTEGRTAPFTDLARPLGAAIGAATIFVAALIVATGVSSLGQLELLHANVHELGEDRIPSLTLIDGIEDATDQYRRTQLQHVIETNSQRSADLEALLANQAVAAGSAFIQYEKHDNTDRARAAELRGLWDQYLFQSAPFLEASRGEDNARAIGILNGPASATYDSMTTLLREISREEAAASALAVTAADTTERGARSVALWLMAAGAVIVLVIGGSVGTFSVYLARRTTSTLKRLAVGEREAAILNQFTELAALTDDDAAATAATLATLDELVSADDSMLHVSNRSQDRAVPEASLGEHPAEVMSLHELGRCPALRRSALYITHDVTARLSFRCPVYPVESGTVACVPLIALGEPVGVAHLHWNAPRELPLSSRTAITRVTEHAALSIANRRLLLALRSQAGTDARTGLANSRTFDEVLERKLADRRGGDQLAVLMLDLDHFKDFNDAHGHPAGDEALRVFGEVLRSCVRDGDVAARYGGEEFAVLLPDLSADAALQIAERIRERTESCSVALAPGKTGRLTVSIGVATAPEDATQRVSLLRLADEALYRAKTAGRNRVVTSRVAPSLAVVPVGKAAAQ